MKEFARRFYKSKQWQAVRAAYAKSVDGLCEECLKRGIYKPGTLVHHRVHITAENITDASVTMDWRNLELLCVDCHAKVHAGEAKPYRFDADGNIIYNEKVMDELRG